MAQKTKSTTELRDESAQLTQRTRQIAATARTENRGLTPEERTELAQAEIRQAEIAAELAELRAQNNQPGIPAATHAPRRTFSLGRAIRNAVAGSQQTDAELPILEEGAAQLRACGKTLEGQFAIPIEHRAGEYTTPQAPASNTLTAAMGATDGILVDTYHQDILLPLMPSLIVTRLGARVMSGLTADLQFDAYSGTSVSWEGENDEAKDGAGTFSKKKTFKPNRLTAYVDISKQLLIQENQSVEALIRRTLVEAVAHKLESTIFGAAATATGVPDGLFTGVTPTITGALSWANIVKMETELDTSNALLGNLAYVLHPALIGKTKTTVKDSSGAGGFVFDGSGVSGMLNGYKCERTNYLPKALGTNKDEYGAIFGNWADFFVGQWGAIDITVDTYTQATKGMIRLIINSYFNAGTIRNESFVRATFK